MLLYENESYKIRGSVFDVYKKLGCGHKEIVYQKAVYISFLEQGLAVEKEKRLTVIFNGKDVGIYIPDFVVNRIIMVELKAKPFVAQEDVRQFWQYLAGTNYKLGFLINFGKPGGAQIIRRVYDNARKLNK